MAETKRKNEDKILALEPLRSRGIRSTQEVEGESYPNRSVPMTGTLDSVRRHPFTDSIIGVPLPDKWKGLTWNVMMTRSTLMST